MAEAAHAVVEAEDAGVWVFGGGLHSYEEVSVVAIDGTWSRTGPHPEGKAYIGGFSVVDVPACRGAVEWAARIAVACRCAQEVREFVPGSTLIAGVSPPAALARGPEYKWWPSTALLKCR